MNQWKQNALFVLAGASLTALGGFMSCKGGFSAKAVVIVALGLFLTVGASWLVAREVCEILSTRKAIARLGTPARVALEMPYHELAARFMALGKADAGVLLSPGYFSWSVPVHGRISIAHGDGDEWKALFWLNDAATQQELHGLALYRRGELSVYPASAQAHFAEAYLENLLHPSRDAFNQWLSAHGSASRR